MKILREKRIEEYREKCEQLYRFVLHGMTPENVKVYNPTLNCTKLSNMLGINNRVAGKILTGLMHEGYLTDMQGGSHGIKQYRIERKAWKRDVKRTKHTAAENTIRAQLKY